MGNRYGPFPEDAARLEAFERLGSQRAAARELGCNADAVRNALRRAGLIGGPEPTLGYEITGLRTTTGKSGEVIAQSVRERPDTGDVPDSIPGFGITGRTVHRVGGKATQSWDRESIEDRQRAEMLRAIIEARCENVRPHPPIDLLHTTADDLCNLVTITDAHVGALAQKEEGGADWDLKIAKETLTRCFVGMVRRLPPARVCVINQLGDFLHTDGLTPLTPGHGHVLDADSRYQKMSEVGCDILEDIIAVALERHEHVEVKMCEGNHDESGSGWMRILFKRLFRDNPRVTVDDSQLPYYVFRHGQVMLAFHHGHKLKPESLPLFFAAQFPRMWGETDKRYSHSGHQHHLDEKDRSGMRTMQHPTLAARDAYAARGGWISPREAIGITYNLHGEDSRMTVTPEMFQ